MKNIAIITLSVALEGEKGYSRFRTLSELLSKHYNVDLITSSFQHWEKKQRDTEKLCKVNRAFNVKFAYEPGYKKNVDLKRIHSHKIAMKNILSILEKNKYDLIYCIFPDNKIAANVGTYAKNHNIPFIIDVEDLWPEAMEMVSPLPSVMNRIIFNSYRRDAKIAFECADGFIGTSDEYRDYPQKQYRISGKPHYTVYVGCDVNDFDDGVKEHIDSIEKKDGEFWVTYAGNLGSSYDIPTMIRAAQELYSDYSNIKVKLLGGGPLEDEFKAIAKERPCNVEFVGYTPYRKMAAYLVKSDILVNSFVKKAPQSIVTKIGDYLAAGKPMINTLSSPEFRSKVENDGFGVNVVGEDVDALKNAIIQLYDDQETRKAMGEQAREVCMKEFDRKNSYKVIIDLIDRLINKK